jgi:hypothetical protein
VYGEEQVTFNRIVSEWLRIWKLEFTTSPPLLAKLQVARMENSSLGSILCEEVVMFS